MELTPKIKQQKSPVAIYKTLQKGNMYEPLISKYTQHREIIRG